MVWGALLGVSLQARASQLAPQHALSAYATLAAVGAATAAVTQIAAGVASDRRRAMGSRRIEFYAVGAIAAVGALFWFYSAATFSQLLGATAAVQCALNVAIGPYQAIIPDFVKDEHTGTASSWMAALQSAGNAAGAVAAGVISNSRLVALAIAAVLLSTCAATVAQVRRLPMLPAAPKPLQIGRSFVDLFVSRALVYLGFYTLVGYLYFYVASTLSGNAKMMTAAVLLVFTMAGVLGAAAIAAPANRADRRSVATLGGAGFILAVAAFLVSHSVAAVGTSALIAGIAWGIFLTADWALGCRLLPRHALATAMGVWNLALLVPQIAAPLIATGVLSAAHALGGGSAARIAFEIAAVEVAAGIAWIWRLPASTQIG